MSYPEASVFGPMRSPLISDPTVVDGMFKRAIPVAEIAVR
jgi:hypothetical protein